MSFWGAVPREMRCRELNDSWGRKWVMRIIEYNKIPAVKIKVLSEREIHPSVFVTINIIFIIFAIANGAH